MQLMLAKMTSEAPRRRNTCWILPAPCRSGREVCEVCSLFCVKKVARNNWISMISSIFSYFFGAKMGGPNGIAIFLEKISY